MSESVLTKLFRCAMWPPEPYAVADEGDISRYAVRQRACTKKKDSDGIPALPVSELRFPHHIEALRSRKGRADTWEFERARQECAAYLKDIPPRFHTLCGVYAPALVEVMRAFEAAGFDVREDRRMSGELVGMMARAIEKPTFLWSDILMLQPIPRVAMDRIAVRDLVQLSPQAAKEAVEMRHLKRPPEIDVFLDRIASAFARELGVAPRSMKKPSIDRGVRAHAMPVPKRPGFRFPSLFRTHRGKTF